MAVAVRDLTIAPLPPYLRIHSTDKSKVTAATVAQVGRSTIEKWIKQGHIKAVKYGAHQQGGVALVSVASLLAFLDGLPSPMQPAE